MQVVDLVQKISDLRYKLGAGQDEGVTIPKAQGGLWVPQITTPAVSACWYSGLHFTPNPKSATISDFA